MFNLLRRKNEMDLGIKRTKHLWISRVSNILKRTSLDENVWDHIEELLIAADVGMNLTSHVTEILKTKCASQKIVTTFEVIELLKYELIHLLGEESSVFQNMEGDNPKGPLVILVVGVNGSGKTTSVAKLAHYFKEQDKSLIIAASDTYRAAAIEQLKIWGKTVGVDVISHKPGGDPAAVAFDAFEAAVTRGIDIVLVDTAGRLHTKINLMEEMKKIKRIFSRIDSEAPHEILLVLDATTGQNGLVQALSFTEAVDCTGIFLSKMDGTSRGGVVVPIVYELGLPILFIGTGESMSDMAPFSNTEFVNDLFS